MAAVTLGWVSRNWALHLAEHRFGARGMAHVSVSCLGETGWEWHVWEASHQLRPSQGKASTVAEAKERAELAVARMVGRSLLPMAA